jgi:hypothetical protein
MLEGLFAQLAGKPAPIPVMAVSGRVEADAMFAARKSANDGYDEYDEPRARRSSVGERAARRTGGVASRKKGGETMKIVGIVFAVLVGVGLIAMFVNPKSDVKMSGAAEADDYLWGLGRTIFEWKQKFSNDNPKLFPPGQDNWFSEVFIKDFTEYKLNVSKGFVFYYSVSADRTKFVIAGAPATAGGWDKCYCVVQENLEADRKIYEAIWKSEADMLPPENGNMPATTNGWSQIEPPIKRVQ